MTYPLIYRLIAELAGTAMLVLFGAGSVVAALTIGDGSLSYAGLGFIALTFAIVVAVVIHSLGHVSGAHINPAVTFALAVTKRFAWSEVGPYMLAQLLGGAVGAFVVVAMFGSDAVDLGGVGGTALGDGVSFGAGVVAEVVGTFILVFTIMAVAVDSRAAKGWAGLMIGLAVACAVLVIGPLTGASLNPARTFGPNVAASLFGGSSDWAQFALYCIGPLLGAVAAAVSYDVIAKPRAVAEESAKESAHQV